MCHAWHGIRGGSAERKMRLLPLLLPTWTVGMWFSRVQGWDAESKPDSCMLKEEEKGEIKNKSWTEIGRECASRSRLSPV